MSKLSSPILLYLPTTSSVLMGASTPRFRERPTPHLPFHSTHARRDDVDVLSCFLFIAFSLLLLNSTVQLFQFTSF
jgi:hypothetical protein